MIFGHSYSEWNTHQKHEFLTALVKTQISQLDTYVDSLTIINPFEQRIEELKKIDVEIVYRGDFIYPNSNIAAHDVIMCNQKTGMLYYTTSFQETMKISPSTEAKNSYLYFQQANQTDPIPKEVEQILKRDSTIHFADGSKYHLFSNIQPKEILLLLNYCKGKVPWITHEYLSIVNEGDCFNPSGEFKGLIYQEKLLHYQNLFKP
ncbi:MAG: hypothetical protein PUB18_02185 [bacterium]|nr:hypothetical protein [bacterium]